jgi:hypothetical protein
MARPTKYKSEYCEKVIELMAEGASKTEVCAEIGICYDTFLDWQKANKEFSESVKRGDKLSEAWWLKSGRLNLENNKFSYTGWYMNMKNRHGWKDKQEVEQSGEVTLKITESDADLL